MFPYDYDLGYVNSDINTWKKLHNIAHCCQGYKTFLSVIYTYNSMFPNDSDVGHTKSDINKFKMLPNIVHFGQCYNFFAQLTPISACFIVI